MSQKVRLDMIMDAMFEPISVLYRSGSTTIGHCANVLFVFAVDEPTRADAGAVLDHGHALSRQWKSGIGMLLCVAASTRPPGQDARQRVADALDALAPNLLAISGAVLGEGFGAAAKRSVISFVLLGIKTSGPTKVFGDMRSALDWIVEQTEGPERGHLDRRATARELERLFEGLAAS